ncbi:hypothetical protein M9H77_35583 [Catharanthus roseus]|uniref:Uncharacterized protein n=1 Tax=Catharanthus roseus TaxID=4058 RepID=A0ACB9ZPR2_CATRO|nr:hypothetical protein M9H77_35583 [Catharanthus roseus]
MSARSDTPSSSSALTTQLSSSTALSTNPAAWKPPHSDTQKLLTLNINRLRATTYISGIMQEQFIDPYHHWSEVPPDVRDMWWGKFQKKCVWYPTLSLTKMRQMMEYLESLEYNAFCKWNKRNINERRGGRGAGKQTGGCISFIEHLLNRQVDLTEMFSKSRHLEELHKHQQNFTRPTEGRGESCSHRHPMPDYL